MDEEQFWSLVERAREESGGDCEAQAGLLTEWLSGRTPEEILAYAWIFDTLMARSYRWDLWAAAYIINGGCSDDGFDYFRGWLIAQGRRVFEDALRDPETLVGVPAEDEVGSVECEDMLAVPYEAHRRRTGQELPPPACATPPNRPATAGTRKRWTASSPD